MTAFALQVLHDVVPSPRTILLVTTALACASEAPAPDYLTGNGGADFMEVTAAAGVTHTYDFPAGIRAKSHVVVNVGGGVVAEDLDEDGWPDLYVADGAGQNSLFWNVGYGRFSEGAEAAGARFEGDWTIAVGAADIDNDGDQDLYLLNRERDRLLRNDGGRRFTDIAAAAGTDFDGAGLGVQFGDLDGDRLLDLFVSSTVLATGELQTGSTQSDIVDWGLAQSRLLHARPDGTYVEVQDLVQPSGLPPSNPFVGALVDLDGDGDLDLYLVEDTQGRVLNALYENRGKNAETGFVNLVDVSATCNCQYPMAGMGLGLLDYDGNGLPDLYVTNIQDLYPNREALLLNKGSLVFQDVTEAIGAYAMDGANPSGPRAVSWGAVTLDVQNDTLEDLLVVYGELVMDPRPDGSTMEGEAFLPAQPDALLIGQPDGQYAVQLDSGLEDVGRGHAAVTADFDLDGCQDVYLVNLESPSRLYRNRCRSGYAWVALDLEGTRSNRDGIGARIRVKALGRTQWRHLTGCSTSVHSCGPKRVHVGLGPASVIDELEIRWPSGAVQRLDGLAINRVHKVVEPATNE